MLPHLSYPSSVLIRSDMVVFRKAVLLVPYMVWWLHGCYGRGMREAQPGALATKPRVRKASGATVQPRRAKGIAVGTGEGAHLGIATHVLVPQRSGLGLAMCREARLVERRADTGPGTEAPYLRRHEGVLRISVRSVVRLSVVRIVFFVLVLGAIAARRRVVMPGSRLTRREFVTREAWRRRTSRRGRSKT